MMRVLNIGILANNIENSQYKDIWKPITKILSKEKIPFYTVEELKNKFPHKKDSINVYLALNDEGVQNWKELGNPNKNFLSGLSTILHIL